VVQLHSTVKRRSMARQPFMAERRSATGRVSMVHPQRAAARHLTLGRQRSAAARHFTAGVRKVVECRTWRWAERMAVGDHISLSADRTAAAHTAAVCERRWATLPSRPQVKDGQLARDVNGKPLYEPSAAWVRSAIAVSFGAHF
jgi:hypothetical protein